jgi:PilZ domain
VSVKEFLKQRAVNIAVGGQYTLSNWFDAQGKPRTFACRTSRVSPFRMMVNVPVVGKIGDRISTYFGDFGKLQGEISDTMAGGFLLELEMTRPMREKMSSKLTWLEMRQKDSTIRDVRKNARIIPADSHSTLTFADGSSRGCFVIDMSVSGAAVSADFQPEIGMPLAVGACVGRVVRIFPEGFAVQFVEAQNRDDLERRIARAPQPSSGGVVRTAPRSDDARPMLRASPAETDPLLQRARHAG